MHGSIKVTNSWPQSHVSSMRARSQHMWKVFSKSVIIFSALFRVNDWYIDHPRKRWLNTQSWSLYQDIHDQTPNPGEEWRMSGWKKKTEGGKVWIWWYIGTKRHHRTMDFFFALTNTNICLSVNYKQLKSVSSAQEDFSLYHHISTQSPCKKKGKRKPLHIISRKGRWDFWRDWRYFWM